MKSPKEKAEEIIKKILTNIPDYKVAGRDGLNGLVIMKDAEKINNTAKQCALIAVDEILAIIETLDKPEYTAFLLKDKLEFETEYAKHFNGYDIEEYFKEVKSEIEKL